ncbi:pyridoxal phosphate-dependent decarboxylase family protein [Aeromicrobium sp.]|uniref:pyridoxal phosphate-dependent decarboxylase family protein n=1 Tax=Aeromicrobium sp. TaxID=1871063 RepID=UPI003C6BB17C
MADASDALDRARAHTQAWLDSLDSRAVPPRAGVDEIIQRLGRELPDGPTDATDVIDLLAEACEPGLTAMPSGRFFGFVIGGTHPAALAADWLTSAWDQNAGLRNIAPAHSAVEDVAEGWLLDLLGLPTDAAVGFVTGATMANFTGLAAGREAVLSRVGWDTGRHGLAGSPGVRVMVGAERHDSVDLVLRYLGLGEPEPIAADDQGRIDVTALRDALADGPDRPTIVVLQAGNLHSGAFDPFADAIAAAHEHGAWVHIDGAFGLFAGASPVYRHLVAGHGAADSWSTDAHKTLNVPYDCGLVIVRDAAVLRKAMSMHGAYLIRDEAGDPFEKVPELSRRGRAIPVWAVLRAMGRTGAASLVEGLAGNARSFADGIAQIPGAHVLNDVVFTQVCATFGDDALTREVVRLMMEDGTAWTTGSVWRGQAVLRISVSNWSTTSGDVERTLVALRAAVDQATATSR